MSHLTILSTGTFAETARHESLRSTTAATTTISAMAQ
jgi:hypothetical protein